MNIIKKHKEFCSKGFAHYRADPNDLSYVESSLDFIMQSPKNIGGASSNVSDFYKSKGILNWFKNRNLNALKQGFYVAAKCEIISSIEREKPHYECSHKLYALLSDNEEILSWYAQDVGALYNSFGKGAQRNKINSFDYYKFNFFLAMQGYWDLLARRCEYILANPPAKKYQSELTHHVFYLALAKGDKEGMKDAIEDIISPKKLHKQNMSGCPIPRFFISYWGTLFAKMAWRHGYQLEFNNPWIPQEWLPVKPLARYDDPHDFLKYEIYTPYKGEYEKYSSRRDKTDWLDLAEGSWPPI